MKSLRLALAATLSLFFVACAEAPEAPQAPSSELDSAETSSVSTELQLPPSCYDECYWAKQTCPRDCQISVEACAAETEICYDSCTRGVGPWLPC